ncbi:MAG: tRNA preQ1(34) S-adenosylmethionine ribosyltransferase-isomerase QueA [Candidatus Omnitrophica bacterium]|nr:tRNA preQ1(34) S-adenosylmethionine ribosyltransferase-isomerase QueA [Candidatus Omnitrophota bacterium]
MKLSDFSYDLPKEHIAQEPIEKRDLARLMVVDRAAGDISCGVFRDISGRFNEGDCMVFNDTRVIPARILGNRKTGGKVEIFLLDTSREISKALVKPSKKIKEGEMVVLEDGSEAEILGKDGSARHVKFNKPLEEILRSGHVPLPPYIERADTQADKELYQTVYARNEGATAAPTAGLHFTEGLIKELADKGVQPVYVTLHTGYGTFAPVKEEAIENHKMHSEYYKITEDAASAINTAKHRGKRVICVGTTSARVVESVSNGGGEVTAGSGYTDIFIYPGYRFKTMDSLITNFHLPCSTLVMLASAFAGKELLFRAYELAIDRKFRFFSYGDAMLVI